VGEAVSADSGNGETDGDSERSGVIGEVAKVFEVAAPDSAGIGVAFRENSGSVPPERSGSVTPGGRRGVRTPPGDEAIAGFLKGRVGGRIAGACVFVVAPFFSSNAFLRALNSARRRSSSLA
jgi:hypothetical protein